jgi:O-antigen/teichoic acid export membrane protein
MTLSALVSTTEFPAMARFQNALLWSFATTGGRQGINALLTFTLAAILGPEAFGTVAMASIFVRFIQMFLEQGLGPAIVQRQQLEEAHKNSAFWMVVGLSFVLVSLGVGLSRWWAGVNDLPELAEVISVLSLLIPLEALTVVQQALLRRHMEFKKLALRANVSVLCGGAVGLTLAFNGYGVWALVAQHLTTSATGVLLLWAVCDWRPSFRFSRSAASDLISFSSGAFLGRIAIFVNNRSDALLMGIFFGPVAVGLYRLADRLMGLLVDLSSRSIQAVALPEFSRLQSDPTALAASALRCLRISATIAIVPLAVMAASSHELMQIVGEKWAEAALPLSLLCGVGMVRAVTLITGPIMRALGRPYAHALFMWAHAIPSAAAFWAVASWLQTSEVPEQAAGIALSRVLLFALLFLPINCWIVVRMVSLSFGSLASAVAPAVAAGAIGAGVALGLHNMSLTPLLGIPTSIVGVVVPGFVAIIALAALDRRFRQQVLQRVQKFRARRDDVNIGSLHTPTRDRE